MSRHQPKCVYGGILIKPNTCFPYNIEYIRAQIQRDKHIYNEQASDI